MNYYSITRLASLALAIGFFLACSTSKPNIDTLVQNSMYEEALTEINTSLQANPNQSNLYIKKGEINLALAQKSEITNRVDFYSEAVKAYSEAIKIGISPEQEAELLQHLYLLWEDEFNAGSELIAQEVETETALAHFRNAITLQSEQSSAYISLSVVQYYAGDIDEAIATLTQAKNNMEPVPAQVYENLGFLYLQNGDTQNSMFYYELANTNISQDKNIAFGVVNTYILNNELEKAVDILSQLSENFPNDARIKNVYGTQLYNISAGILDDLAIAYQQKDSSLVSQIKFEAEGVSEQAEEELISAYQLDNTNKEYVESLAVFYNNMLSKYLYVYDIAFEEDKSQFDNKAEILLGFAIQYYDKLSSFSPNDLQITATLDVLEQLKSIRFSN